MRSRHDPAYLVYRDMIRDCEDGDEHACRYLIDHDAAEHFQLVPDTFTMRQFPELVVGAFVVWLLVIAWLGVLI